MSVCPTGGVSEGRRNPKESKGHFTLRACELTGLIRVGRPDRGQVAGDPARRRPMALDGDITGVAVGAEQGREQVNDAQT